MLLSDYRLLTQLSAGSDGVAYRAQVEATGAPVEVRVLGAARADPARWPACLRRLLLAALVEQPNAQRVLKCRLDGDPPFIALELIDAPTVAEALAADLPLPAGEAVPLLIALGEALAEAHRLGLAHERLVPSAIHLRTGRRPVLDFTGLHVTPQAKELAALDLACQPPEATRDAAADLFQLGSLLAWLLHGKGFLASFKPGANWESMAATSAGPAVLLPSSGDTLEQLIRDLRALDPANRPTARQTVERLLLLRGAPAAQGAATGIAATGILPSPLAQSLVDDFRLRPRRDAAEFQRARLGRFRLLDKLGQGGMGAVYRAEDPADGKVVAIKVLRQDWANDPESLRRFRKEARLLAEVNNPFVTNLLEVNEDDGVHFLAMEFVAGRSLDRILKEHDRLEELTAVRILADVCRGLVAAHRQGIVHRDIKPDNILIDGGFAADDAPENDKPMLVKLSDFGLARHVVESESLRVTQAGAILGTPLYMPPEQCRGQAVDVRADVYSLGATLFHLLAGRPPFLGDNALALINQHCKEPPPALKKLLPELSDGVCQIVEKALAKAPEARYADAEAMLFDLDRLLRGEPTSIVVHPRLPVADPKNVLRYDWTLELEAAPEQLWPFVANTERFNRAIGLPAVGYAATAEPSAAQTAGQVGPRVRREGQFHKLGMDVRWEEHPFEWIEGRRFGVLREYTQGPFKWLVSMVDLAPRSEGGTTLTHRVVIEPHTFFGRTAAAVEVGVKTRRAAEKVYRRVDAALTGKLGRTGFADPFEETPALSGARRERLDRLIGKLEERGVDPITAERLGEFLATAPDQEVARMRPLALAKRLRLPAEQVIAACLHGAREGLLILLWDLLCPICRIPSEVQDTLKALKEHGHCEACNFDYELDFASSVEMIFRVHPEIRPSELRTYCIGGPAHFPHVVAQVRVAAGERLDLDLALAEGAYRLRGPQLPYTVEFQVQPHAPVWRVDWPLPRPPDARWTRTLRSGAQVISLANEHPEELVVRLERVAARADALTAARAAALGLFRELFPGEVLSPRQLMSVSTVTFLATQLGAASAIYRSLGDVQAFGVIHEHFQVLEDQIRRAGGALVKTVGEGLLAAFHEPQAAVAVALNLPEVLSKHGPTRDLKLRLGLHRGPVMAATLNDHLDYFGTAVNTVWQLVGKAHDGEILITEPVSSDPQAALVLQQRGLDLEVINEQVDERMPLVQRVRPARV